MDPKLSPGLCIATKCSIVDPLGPLFYMSAQNFPNTYKTNPELNTTEGFDFFEICLHEIDQLQ